MQSELKPCPFCSAELTVPTTVQYPKLGLARLHPGSLDDGSCPIAGWGFYDEQLAAWNARASDAEITRLTEALRAAEEREKALREALGEICRDSNPDWAERRVYPNDVLDDIHKIAVEAFYGVKS